jgi:hypothetical protein
MRAFSSLVTALPQESDFDSFQEIIPVMMKGLLKSVELGSVAEAIPLAYAESMIDMSDDCSAYFCLNLPLVFQTIIELIELSTLQSAVRRMLVEFLVGISTAQYKKLRKLKGPNSEKGYFASRFFPICARLMWDVQEVPGWGEAQNTEEEEEEGEEMQNSDMGETALDRVTQALGLRSTFAVISSQLSGLLGSSVWQHQRAGLRIMGNYLEVSARISDKNQLIQHRSDIANTLTNFTRSPHIQVRAAAYYAICQLFVMQGRDLSAAVTEQLLGVLLSGITMTENPAPRIRRNAVLSLLNLIDVSATSLLESWGDRILNGVIGALLEGPLMVQECCVSCIVSFAESVKGEQLASYYDSIMPILKQLLGHAQAQEHDSLWGQTIECCAIVGEASGKVKFHQDALDMMQSLSALQETMDEESEAKKYLLKAWVRIARCLGSDFLPFFPMVMSKLLVAISQDISSGTGGINLEELEQRSDVEIIETEDGWLAVRTAAVEEQSTACQLMVLLSEKLQEHFYPYVEDTIRAMVPLLNSPHEVKKLKRWGRRISQHVLYTHI